MRAQRQVSPPKVGNLPENIWSTSYLQTGEGSCHGDGVDTLCFAQMSAEVTTRRSFLLLQVNLGVQRGRRVGARVEGGERPLPVSPGEPLVRDLTQTLAAYSRLAFKAAQ